MSLFLSIFATSILLYLYYGARVDAQLRAAPPSHTPDRDAPTPAVSPTPLPVPSAPEGVPDVAMDELGDVDPDYLDMAAFTPKSRPSVPSIRLRPTKDGAYVGGAAGGHLNAWISGPFVMSTVPFRIGDRRQTRRRGPDRRADATVGAATPANREDHRLVQRRVWLRRESDHKPHDLVDIHEAARMLSATPEAVERWILSADLPFYMVTKGAIREKRFDRVELLGWMGAEDVLEARAREERGQPS